MLIAGTVPLVVGCVVNMAKFGVPFGLPITEGSVYRVLGGPNGGHEFSLRFLPSTLAAYLRPDGIRLTPVFPFITLPAQVAEGVGGVSVVGSRTASLTATMPFLFVLAVWGLIIAFRPRLVIQLRAIRLLIIAAAAGTGATLIFAWISDRYLADFLPLLILGAALGAIDIWSRLRGRQARVVLVCLFASLVLLEVATNTAMAVTPDGTWTQEQMVHYVDAQHRVSDITGHPLAQNVELGYRLPSRAPADQLFVQGYCDKIYISDGETPPNRSELIGSSWLLVEDGPHASLCPLLVDEGRLKSVLRTSLVRADAVFSNAASAYGLWLLFRHGHAQNAILAQTISRQIGALRQFDVSLDHVVNVGLPDAHARALTRKLLADTGSILSALANAASQNENAETAGPTRDVVLQWSRTTFDYTSLLHELVVPAT